MLLFKSKIKLRIHTHKEYSPSVFTGFSHAIFWLPYAVGLLVLTVLAGLVIAVLGLCNMVGLALLWSPKLVGRMLLAAWAWLIQDIKKTVLSAPTHINILRQRQFAFGLAIFLGVILSVFGTLEVGNLLAGGVEIKGRVLGQVRDAVSSLETGKQDVLSEDLESAEDKFGLALEQFQQSSDTLRTGNILFSSMLRLLPAGRDAQRLLQAGEAGTQTALHVTNVAKILSSIHVGENGLRTGGSEEIRRAQTELGMARSSLATANDSLLGVDVSNIPLQYQKHYSEVTGLLSGLSSSLQTVSNTFDMLLFLVEGHKHLLVLMQNSNELRATGGFMGTFGAFDLVDGAVSARNISSIYDLDGQLKTKFTPPLPLFAVNNRWFMRDSNWFASFPESAETIKTFYREETGINPDIILAVTPEIAIKLLKLTGPIYLPTQDVTVDADNFVEVTQVETSINYDKVTNKPKQMLADLFPILLDKLVSLRREKLPSLLATLEQSLMAKDVLVYSGDQHTSELLNKLGFDGRLAETQRDYLNIVSSNLGGTKTDLAMRQSVSLNTDIRADGHAVNTLKIYRENPLPHAAGLENKDFIRVYVPLGSKLLSAKGFSYVNVDVQPGRGEEKHPRALAWESDAVKELDSGTMVGVESGKTFFGNWVVLEGGQSQTVEITYELPFRLDLIDRYSIAVQKQPGANTYTLKYGLSASNYKILWSTDPSLSAGNISKEFDISRDRFYGLVLQSY